LKNLKCFLSGDWLPPRPLAVEILLTAGEKRAGAGPLVAKKMAAELDIG